MAANSPTNSLKLIHPCWWHWRWEIRYCCKQCHSMVIYPVLFRTLKKHPATHFVGGDKLLRINIQEWQRAAWGNERNSPRRKRQLYLRKFNEVWKDEASSCLRSYVSEKVHFNPSWHNTFWEKSCWGQQVWVNWEVPACSPSNPSGLWPPPHKELPW